MNLQVGSKVKVYRVQGIWGLGLIGCSAYGVWGVVIMRFRGRRVWGL